MKTKVAGRGWTHWYKLPFINYGDSDVTIPAPVEDTASYALGDRLLKKGVSGADVTALQEALLKLGYVLPKYGADGKYGVETEAAVLAFQKATTLTQDGKYGSQSHAALMAALEKLTASEPEQKYTLHLGVFDTKAEAELVRTKLEASGFTAVISEYHE